MHYGLFLGLFWVFRYIFLIVGGAGISDRFTFLFYLLNIGTLLLIYIFYYKYRNSNPDLPKGFLPSLLFTVLLCFYASFLEGVIMFAHFKFIDPAYFAEMIQPFLKSIESVPAYGFASDQDMAQAREMMTVIYSSKITYIILEFIRNIFLGIFLGIVLYFIIGANKKS